MNNIIINQYSRSWKTEDEIDFKGISFYLKHKPNEIFFITLDKRIDHCWNIHFLVKGTLLDCEILELVNAVINYIKEDEYLTSSGKCMPEDITKYFNKFIKNNFEDTGCIRVLTDLITGNKIYIPILKKYGKEYINTTLRFKEKKAARSSF